MSPPSIWPAEPAWYRGQMAAYAYALEEVTGIPVVRRVLWFLVPNLGVELS